MVTKALKLDKLKVLSLLKSQQLSVPGEPDDIIDKQELSLLILATLLENIEFLSVEQRALILDATCGIMHKAAYGATFLQLAFADRRYVVWSGHQGVMDITTGDILPQMPVQPMETIAYNLNATYIYFRLKIERLGGLHVKQQNTDRTLEEPADLLDSASDGLS